MLKNNMKTEKEVIEAIHNEFDYATENLIKEAQSLVIDSAHADRLSALGFKKCAAVKTVQENKAKIERAKHVSDRVTYFQKHYPNYKFITESLVDKICEKYGLVHGKVSIYLGDVPEKNLKEIETFTLKKEDYTQRVWEPTSFLFTDPMEWGFLNNRGFGRTSFADRYLKDLNRNTSVEQKKVKAEFEICAPPKDFDMTNHKRVGNKIVPKDPIVLQPVEGGYLIITKWGLEANDPEVANEKLN